MQHYNHARNNANGAVDPYDHRRSLWDPLETRETVMAHRHGLGMLSAGMLSAAVLLAACEPVEPDPEDTAELEARIAELEGEVEALEGRLATMRERFVDGVPRTLPANSVGGVDEALRAYLPDPDFEWLPGVTRWRDGELELPEELTDPAAGTDSHGQLTLRLVDAVVDADEFGGPVGAEFSFPWEITARVHRIAEDEAVAVDQQRGALADDSVSGIDNRYT
jgi:hypothetical protein